MILRKGEAPFIPTPPARAPAARQAHHIAGNHQLFIGIDDRHFDHRIFGLNKGSVVLVFLFIDRQPEEIQVMADGAPGAGGVFADAAGKDQRVQAAHLHNIAADGGANALGKQRERQGCLTITAVRRLLDIAIIVRDAGNPSRPDSLFSS